MIQIGEMSPKKALKLVNCIPAVGKKNCRKPSPIELITSSIIGFVIGELIYFFDKVGYFLEFFELGSFIKFALLQKKKNLLEPIKSKGYKKKFQVWRVSWRICVASGSSTSHLYLQIYILYRNLIPPLKMLLVIYCCELNVVQIVD